MEDIEELSVFKDKEHTDNLCQTCIYYSPKPVEMGGACALRYVFCEDVKEEDKVNCYIGK